MSFDFVAIAYTEFIVNSLLQGEFVNVVNAGNVFYLSSSKRFI